MITDLLPEFKKEHNGAAMNFGSKAEVEIHEKGYYEKIEFILDSCKTIREKIIEQEEAKVGYIACTDPSTEKDLVREINVLNKGIFNIRNQQ
jgi:hypothetical protein